MLPQAAGNVLPHYAKTGSALYVDPVTRMLPAVLPYGRRPIQTGGGLWGVISRLFSKVARWIIPGLKRAASSSTGKVVKKGLTKIIKNKQTQKAATQIVKALGKRGSRAITAVATGNKKKAKEELTKGLLETGNIAKHNLRTAATKVLNTALKDNGSKKTSSTRVGKASTGPVASKAKKRPKTGPAAPRSKAKRRRKAPSYHSLRGPRNFLDTL